MKILAGRRAAIPWATPARPDSGRAQYRRVRAAYDRLLPRAGVMSPGRRLEETRQLLGELRPLADAIRGTGTLPSTAEHYLEIAETCRGAADRAAYDAATLMELNRGESVARLYTDRALDATSAALHCYEMALKEKEGSS